MMIYLGCVTIESLLSSAQSSACGGRSASEPLGRLRRRSVEGGSGAVSLDQVSPARRWYKERSPPLPVLLVLIPIF